MKIIARGAESIIYIEKENIVKERIKKIYRLNEIDSKLRKYRTRSETKLLEKSASLIDVPKVINFSDKDMKIVMEHIKGYLLKDIINSLDNRKLKEILINVGTQIALLHDNDIIHGDLTTSNMILKDNKVYFIDFGLGFISNKIEDKAVDLHLLKQALQSKHYKICEKAFAYTLEGYKKCKTFNGVMSRLEKVEKRGRYKGN